MQQVSTIPIVQEAFLNIIIIVSFGELFSLWQMILAHQTCGSGVDNVTDDLQTGRTQLEHHGQSVVGVVNFSVIGLEVIETKAKCLNCGNDICQDMHEKTDFYAAVKVTSDRQKCSYLYVK